MSIQLKKTIAVAVASLGFLTLAVPSYAEEAAPAAEQAAPATEAAPAAEQAAPAAEAAPAVEQAAPAADAAAK